MQNLMETAFHSDHSLKMVGGTIAFRDRRVPARVAPCWVGTRPTRSADARYEDVTIPKRRNRAPRGVHRRYQANCERRPLRAVLARILSAQLLHHDPVALDFVQFKPGHRGCLR